MAEVYFIGDLHLGHKNIHLYRDVSDEQSQYEMLKEKWHSVVTKRDRVYLLGDACFTKERLRDLSTWVGDKLLICGNHDLDKLSMKEIVDSNTYSAVYSLLKYKEFWLSHCPIHSDELRGKHCIHGHIHNGLIADERYVNVCVEHVNGKPISLQEIRKRVYKGENNDVV